jgi:hypothetical protein
MKHTIATIRTIFLLLTFISAHHLDALDNQQRNCIILLDQNDSETVGRTAWFLISRIQSAIAEQSTPILMNTNLWNSFIERKINFNQKLEHKNGSLYKIYNLYQNINERMEHLSHHYNALSSDASHNKKLVIQCINKEFYNNTNNISAADYQRLLDYSTQFNPQDWDIYKNNGGFYLLIPKQYSAQHSLVGFNIDSLEKVTNPEDNSYMFFEAHNQKSIVDALPDFFLTHDNFSGENMPYAWNIILAGHGGSRYQETNNNNIITWSGEPVIADLTIEDFAGVLTFFENKVSTRFFHYATCYGAGNHIALMFNNKYYNFAIMCDNVTDCATYCKWTTLLPSHEKQFLTTADITYDEVKNCWQLPLTPVYFWGKFFTDMSAIDFSIGSIERLQEMMSSIQYTAVANIPLLCLPKTNTFFPLQQTDVIKIDDQLLALAEAEDENITLNGIKTILVESSCIIPTIELNHNEPLRIISIKPDNALHYIKKLKATHHIDLPSAFWQAEYQLYDKIFIMDECTFPYLYDFKDITPQKSNLVLKNVIITVQKNNCMRILFTHNDTAMMVVAHKPVEEDEQATIQEIVPMSPAAQDKYEKYYALLKESASNQSVA